MVLLKEAMGSVTFRRRLILRWISTAVAVIFGLTTPFLRIELGLSNSVVVLYSVTLGVSVMAASYISKQFSDRLGSRPLVFFSTLFSLFFFMAWVLVTKSVSPVWFFILGFFTNFFVSLISLLTYRLVAQVMPDEETVAFNSMVNFVIAIIAFGVVSLSGFLARQADFARSLSYPWMCKPAGKWVLLGVSLRHRLDLHRDIGGITTAGTGSLLQPSGSPGHFLDARPSCCFYD